MNNDLPTFLDVTFFIVLWAIGAVMFLVLWVRVTLWLDPYIDRFAEYLANKLRKYRP